MRSGHGSHTAGHGEMPTELTETTQASTAALVASATQPGTCRILVVEHVEDTRRLMARLLSSQGYVVEGVTDGEHALSVISKAPPDLIMLDVQMPGLSGFEVCAAIKRNPATRFTPVILVTGMRDRESRIEGIKAGADEFLAKPFDGAELEARVHSLLRLKRSTDELESAESVILSLALTVEARDPYTNGHCERLAHYAFALGQQIGLSPDELSVLQHGGYLHDVGKVGISDSVLLKRSKLTRAEFIAMQQHTVIGDRLCGNMRSLASVRLIVRHHHERLNGSGYPDRLRGEQVPLLAQVVGIVDAYDAMTTSRVYRSACSRDYALSELKSDAAKGLFRPDLVDAFITTEPALSEPTHQTGCKAHHSRHGNHR